MSHAWTILAPAWVPFLHPLPIDGSWLLIMVPLLAAIAVVWKTIKLDDLRPLPRQAASLTAQFIALMLVAALVLWLITEWV